MKGLALVLGGKPKNDSEGASATEAKPKHDSAMEFARLASEASAAGDHESAARAMVNAIKACKGGSYEPPAPAGEDEEE